MIASYDLNASKASKSIKLTYVFLQVPEGMGILEAKFHMNSLIMRQTGKLKEEVVMLIQSK
jgi:hypothetical protein